MEEIWKSSLPARCIEVLLSALRYKVRGLAADYNTIAAD